MDCIFCKIIKGEIPCDKIYEDANTIAFLDINPVNKGHTLVVPKKHFETIFDTSNDTLAELTKAVKIVSSAVLDGAEADGINLGVNNLKAAGQLVPHVHFHVIPRFNGDGLRHWPGKKLSDSEMKDISKKIKRTMQ